MEYENMCPVQASSVFAFDVEWTKWCKNDVKNKNFSNLFETTTAYDIVDWVVGAHFQTPAIFVILLSWKMNGWKMKNEKKIARTQHTQLCLLLLVIIEIVPSPTLVAASEQSKDDQRWRWNIFIWCVGDHWRWTIQFNVHFRLSSQFSWIYICTCCWYVERGEMIWHEI